MDVQQEANMVEGNDIPSDLYEMISNIELQVKHGDANFNREDFFQEGFEAIFGVDIDQIDNIEEIINNRINSNWWQMIYTMIRDNIRSIFDNYLGVTSTQDDINSSIDLNGLYTIYRVLVSQSLDTFGKVFAYIIAKTEDMFNLNRDSVFEDILKSAEYCNLDEIPKILAIMDEGNMDYEYVFGEVPDIDEESFAPQKKVAIDYDVYVKHLLNELRLGAGVMCRENLRRKIQIYTEQINRYHLI